MAAKLIVTAEAEQDINEAYDWYEKRRFGLGEDFLHCVDACYEKICRTPELNAKAHENYRRAMVRRFPYVVFYEYALDAVTVFCVFHTSRDPAKWRERLP